MSKKKDIFALQQIYLLESTKTNQPYINKKGECFLFLHEQDANRVASSICDSKVSDPKFYTLETISSLCYTVGASHILLVVGDKEQRFTLRESEMKIAFYNHQLAKSSTYLRQTGLLKHLYELSLCEYIVPARVKSIGDGVSIKYGAVRHTVNSDNMMYLAFSNLDEFGVWSSQVKGWSPILVSFDRLRRICGKEGFILNPNGNRLVITKDLLDKIDAYTMRCKKSTEENKEEA